MSESRTDAGVCEEGGGSRTSSTNFLCGNLIRERRRCKQRKLGGLKWLVTSICIFMYEGRLEVTAQHSVIDSKISNVILC